MSKSLYKCNECGSADVEQLLRLWARVTEDRIELAETGNEAPNDAIDTYCNGCHQTDVKLVKNKPKPMRLVYNVSGREVHPGDIAYDFRGDKHRVVGIVRPGHGGSTGRVQMEPLPKGGPAIACGPVVERYPGVISAVWINRDDQ